MAMAVFQRSCPKSNHGAITQRNDRKTRKEPFPGLEPGKLPTVRGGLVRGGAAELVAFAVGEHGDSDGHEHRWDDKHENPASEALNDAFSRGSSLRIAK